MNTEIVLLDPKSPNPAAIARAAEWIRLGRLVAFPTETVYGLGASALDSQAVRRIFEAKGRPGSNPLIVHVAEPAQVLNVAREWPGTAERLACRFWPGPLTIVVPKRPDVPNEVTAGGPTVAVRCPDHPIARALLREAGVPIAAPSANRSTQLSPTRAEHVLTGLGGRIDLVLDGGPCPGGLESTVVDVTGDVVRLLRPGPFTIPMLEEVVERVEVAADSAGPVRSPGQMAKHYSPRTPLRLAEPNGIFDDYYEALHANKRVALVTFSEHDLSDNPQVAAAHLYERLHRLDGEQYDFILVELPPDTPEWLAIRDRLTRAASRR